MSCCHIALGGNAGDVVATMDAALGFLANDGIRVADVSSVFETTPVGVHAGGRFLNAAAAVETTLTPRQMLDRLQMIEHQLGRAESARWTRRVIDLDLLLFDQVILETERLTLPHPHLWYRRFVLDPLVELAAETRHPVFDEPLAQLRERLLARPLGVRLTGLAVAEQTVLDAVLGDYKPQVQPVVTRPGPEASRASNADRPSVWLEFLDSPDPGAPARRQIDLRTLPGSLADGLRSVLTAALDTPLVHSRPLWRIP